MKTLAQILLTLTALGVGMGNAKADTLSFFGDFEDFFDSVSYSSTDIPELGSFFLFHSPVLGLPKFDPALGTLTDITLIIHPPGPFDPPSPLFVSIAGGFEASQDPGDPGIDPFAPFGGAATVSGDYGLYYEDSVGALHAPISAVFDVFGMCGGDSPDTSCGDAVGVGDAGGGVLAGSSSIFGLVDPADFIGASETVDSLIIGLFIGVTAEFGPLDNVSGASMTVHFDLFDSDSGADDDVIELIYTFTPVPLPAAWLLFAPVLGWLTMRTRRG